MRPKKQPRDDAAIFADTLQNECRKNMYSVPCTTSKAFRGDGVVVVAAQSIVLRLQMWS